MATSPLSPHVSTPAELSARLAAERAGAPFVVYRDEHGDQQIVKLGETEVVTIGRDADCSVSLPWDSRVSGLHAELSRLGNHWIVADDGLSRNGTFLNGERVVGRRRLHHRDELEVGSTAIAFLEPARAPREKTLAGASTVAPELSPAQQRVLVSLCKPFGDGDQFTQPPSNREIADDLHLTVAAVKTHLRLLFQRFGIEDLPHNEKRARLVELAFETGAVSIRDLVPQ